MTTHEKTHDLVILGGDVIDGSGAPRYRADIGVTGDRISAIRRHGDPAAGPALQGRTQIDAGGRIVAPGFIETPILSTIPEKVIHEMKDRVPLKRLGQPEDIANVYAFLASDDASYINGTVIEVAGGLTL
jgi:urease alpha subunit